MSHVRLTRSLSQARLHEVNSYRYTKPRILPVISAELIQTVERVDYKMDDLPILYTSRLNSFNAAFPLIELHQGILKFRDS